VAFFEKEDEYLLYWKNKILKTLLWVIVIFGLISYIPAIIVSVQEQLLYVVIIDTFALLLAFFLLYNKTLSYYYKTSILMILFYFLGIGLLILLGPYGAGFGWLLGFPVSTAILLNRNAAYTAILINFISMSILGLLIHQGFFDQMLLSDYAFDAWIINSVNILSLSIIIVYPITVIVANMKNKLFQEQLLNQQKEEMVKLIAKKEKVLKKRNQQLEKTNKELDNFIYRVSHDLRAPLLSVIGLIEISKKEESQANRNTYLELIFKLTNKLDRFIKELITFSRTTRMDISYQSIDFNSIIDSVIEDLKFMDNFNKIQIKRSIKKEGEFYSDTMRLKVIFSNLISNAIKYSFSMDREPYILIEVEAGKNYASILVEDNGMGIKEERLSKIFDMFYRANDTHEGTGLGLYIVKEAVIKLQGTIDAESELNKGTRFKMTIPNSR
jgi:signal transduction histidine kinase